MSDTIKVDFNGDGIWPPDGYTGLWEVFWPTGKLKYSACYINGKTHGKVTCWWDDGTPAQTGMSEHGNCRGLWVDYHPNGIKSLETEYHDNDNFTKKWFDHEGSVYETEEWVDGKPVSPTE